MHGLLDVMTFRFLGLKIWYWHSYVPRYGTEMPIPLSVIYQGFWVWWHWDSWGSRYDKKWEASTSWPDDIRMTQEFYLSFHSTYVSFSPSFYGHMLPTDHSEPYPNIPSPILHLYLHQLSLKLSVCNYNTTWHNIPEGHEFVWTSKASSFLTRCI
jgi:hypothetical protein